MPDAIVDFPLRDANPGQLGIALGQCFAEYNVWAGQAATIAEFAGVARAAGVKSVLVARLEQVLDFAGTVGVLDFRTPLVETKLRIAKDFADHQLMIADQCVTISAIVMIHNALERFLWRLVRFGLVANRKGVLGLIKDRKVSIQDLSSQDAESVIDAQIEKWWEELELTPLPKKWDRLVGLVGFPSKLSDPPWQFDRDMLARFDEVRHNAVHHDAQEVKGFNFSEFAGQLSRAQLVWITHVGLLMKLRVPVESLVYPRQANDPIRVV